MTATKNDITALLLTAFTEKIQSRAAEITALQKTYLIAKAMEDEINAKDEEIKRKVLAENEYYICDEMWELEYRRNPNAERRITNPKADFLLCDENDMTAYNDYLDKLYVEYLKTGIADERGRGWIPSAKAHNIRHETENALLDIVIELFKGTEYEDAIRQATKHWKYREQLLDITMKLKAAEN